MAGQLDLEALGHGVDRLLERVVGKRLHATAGVVDDVVVMMVVGVGDLIARDAVAAVEAMQQPELVEIDDRAVDGGGRAGPRGAAQHVGDLLGREQALAVAGEELDDRRAGRSGAAPRAGQLSLGVGEPAVAQLGVHDRTLAKMRLVLALIAVRLRRVRRREDADPDENENKTLSCYAACAVLHLLAKGVNSMIRYRGRWRVLLGALVALLAAAPAASADQVVLSVGHTDLVSPYWDGSSLTLRVKDDTHTIDPGVVYRDPADVLAHVKPEAATTIPAAPQFAFLGTPGETSYILPQVQDLNLLWPGFSSEDASLAPFSGQPFTWRLVDKHGPGEVALWQSGSFGAVDVKFDSRDGLPDAFSPGSTGTHAHYNWAFSATGLYHLTFEVTTPGGPSGPASTGLVEYEFFVGDLADLPSDPEPVETDLTITGLESSYAPGDTVSLTAVQSPPTALDHYHWFRKCGDATEWSVVSGQATHAYTFSAALTDDGCQVEARLYDEDHNVVATSPAVTLSVANGGGPEEPPETGTSKNLDVTADVGAALGLTLSDGSLALGPFLPGVAADYTGTVAATVTSTGPAQLSVVDPSATSPGHLVNGAAVLASPLQANANSGSYSAISATPATLLSFPSAASAAPVTIGLKQAIAASEPLTAGTYGKTITFTVAPAAP